MGGVTPVVESLYWCKQGRRSCSQSWVAKEICKAVLCSILPKKQLKGQEQKGTGRKVLMHCQLQMFPFNEKLQFSAHHQQNVENLGSGEGSAVLARNMSTQGQELGCAVTAVRPPGPMFSDLKCWKCLSLLYIELNSFTWKHLDKYFCNLKKQAYPSLFFLEAGKVVFNNQHIFKI